MSLQPFLRFGLLWSALLAPLPAANTAENLIANPGFEEGDAPWRQNNWRQNEVRFTRDTERPRSGSAAMKMEMVRLINGGTVQLIHPQLPVRGGQTLRVSYWARGVSNGPPLNLLVRKGDDPWTKYFQADSIPTEEWQEFSYTVALPGDVDTANTQFLFQLASNGVVWIDDVRVAEMPPVDEGPAPSSNPVRNGSFEAGRDGWTGTFRLLDFATLREESGSNSPSPEGACLETPESADAPHGGRHLRFEVAPRSRAALTSAYFPARYGRPMTLRFSLRADGDKTFTAAIASGKNASTRFDGRRNLAATGEWRAYEIPVVLKPALDGVYSVALDFLEPGRYDLDAVSLIENDASFAGAALHPLAFAIDAGPDGVVANMFSTGEPAAFRFIAADAPAGVALAHRISVSDFMGRTVAEVGVAPVADAAGRAVQDFRVPTGAQGAFLIRARAADSDEIVAEQIYTVLPPLPPPSERPDSFFGSHVDLTSYNLEVARRAGFRWLRLYPPLITQWMVVQHAPGEWNFRTEAVARAHAQGFRILGNLGTAPDFAADVDPQGMQSRWTRSYPPADLGAWKDYVTRTFTAFGPHVDAWEVWNEPDGLYLRLRPGLNRADVYLSLAKSAREALTETGKPFVLMGPAMASLGSALTGELLEKGVGDSLDAFSFHFYSLKAGGDNPDAGYVLPILERIRRHKNHAGEPLPLWHTEGGIYLAGSQSWLETYRIPHSSPVTPTQAAASMVRSALLFKAAGVKRHFGFMADASETGRRVHEDITCGYMDVTGIPGPGIAAHAAMVALTEDYEADGFESRDASDAVVKIARFKNARSTVEVYWSDRPVALAGLVGDAAGDAQIRDLMGNPLALDDVQLGEFPVYVVRGTK